MPFNVVQSPTEYLHLIICKVIFSEASEQFCYITVLDSTNDSVVSHHLNLSYYYHTPLVLFN